MELLVRGLISIFLNFLVSKEFVNINFGKSSVLISLNILLLPVIPYDRWIEEIDYETGEIL
jgi:hypothetical protein